MLSLDLRSRTKGDAVPLDLATFLGSWVPAIPKERWETAGSAAVKLGVGQLTLDIDGALMTLAVADDGRLEARSGGGGTVVVALDGVAFSDLVQDVVSTMWLHISGRAEIREGTFEAFIEWDLVLRNLLDGRAVYEPGTVDFVDRRGRPLDLQRTFTLDDDPADVGHFLAQAGYLHLGGVFTEQEMEAVSQDLDDAMAAAHRDDGGSWWASTTTGQSYPARILNFNRQSQILRELLRSDRLTRIGTFTGDRFNPPDPEADQAAGGLLKKVGVTEGISDVPWHKDCGPGNHSRTCCGLVVGISVTGAGPSNGGIAVVAGSHRAAVSQLNVERLDLPRISVATQTGDVTVHTTCTLHMSYPPESGERRVVYTGFELAPRPDDPKLAVAPTNSQRDRVAQNDHVRSWQRTHTVG